MKLLNSWRDDHLPCFGFEHNNFYFEVLWTSPALPGRLEMVEDSDASIDAALRPYPQLLKLVTAPDPRHVDGLDRDDDEGDGTVIVYQVEAGCVNVHLNKESYDKEHPEYNY